MSDTHPDQGLADQYAAGLRALADMIQGNPELAPLASYLNSTNVFYGWTKEDLALIARTAKASGFKVDKDAFSDVYKLELHHGPVGFSVLSQRDQVCERVVTGTQVVTKTVKDPEILATVPEVELTETVETFEWRCGSLLAEDTPAEAVSA